MEKKYTLLIDDDTMHDGCVALLDNEKIICILENERVTKHKHALCEKCDAIIDYILNCYNIKKEEVNIVHGLNTKYKNHHELHALATYLSSGYNKANILVIDGYGDQNDSVTLFVGRNHDIYELKKYDIQYSLGLMYDCASRLLYDNVPHSEGKMMGLSCCSQPEYDIPSPIQYHEDGTVQCLFEIKNNNIEESLSDYIKDQFSYLFNEHDQILNIDIYKAKVAATVQWWFTEQVINIAKYLKNVNPNIDNLCVCGGCFLNCETNGILDRLGIFKNIYCIPAPADNSIILGKAQQYLIDVGSKPQIIDSPYLGPNNSVDLEQLKKLFRIYEDQDNHLKSEIYGLTNIQEYSTEWVIDRLKDDRIILWFDGQSEYGPRALGHRSFLANPTTKDTFCNLSINIKHRENYRPLAPITTDKLYDIIFEDEHPENLTQFMLKTVKVKKEWQQQLRAITHINQTARPQRLEEKTNPVLYTLINQWYEQTGLPCLVNTSLNLQGQPLLETYNDLISLCNNANIKSRRCSVVVDHKLCFDLTIRI